MKTRSILIISILLIFSISLNAQNTGNFYIDPERGNDANTGTDKVHPWKSLENINTRTFGPGSKILFKAGSVFIGSLHPKGSGTAQRPIMVDLYDKGPRPIINGNGMTGSGVVTLSNQSYWEISNLEIIDDSPSPGDRRGVEISAANYGLVEHIYLKNLVVHNIKGITGNGLAEKKTAGIYFTVAADSILATRYNDILVENCLLYNIQNQGIVTNNEAGQGDYPGTPAWNRRKITGMIIRNNVIHHISKNAMIIRLAEGGLVEHNLCYETALGITGNTIFSRSCLRTVFQYNEGYLNRSPDYDGSLYDADISSPGTIWQYSYSHDNAHGLMWFCTDQKDTGVIVRYNISQNDKGNLLYINYPFTSAMIYNNVFYTDQKLSPVLLIENGKNRHSYQFYNNIMYNNSSTATYRFAADTAKGRQERMISHNIFFGKHPAGEPAKSLNFQYDPLFVAVGSGKFGLASLSGYMLLEGSPAIGSGLEMKNNGLIDFWGNIIPSSGPPNIGAYNGKAQGKKRSGTTTTIHESGLDRYRADVFDYFVHRYCLTDAAGFWQKNFQGTTPQAYLRKYAKKMMAKLEMQKQVLQEAGCWEDFAGNQRIYGPSTLKSYSAIDDDLAKAVNQYKKLFPKINYEDLVNERLMIAQKFPTN